MSSQFKFPDVNDPLWHRINKWRLSSLAWLDERQAGKNKNWSPCSKKDEDNYRGMINNFAVRRYHEIKKGEGL